MFSKVSVLVPTRQRPARLRTMLDSYEETTQGGTGTELILRIDEDDIVSREFLQSYGNHLHQLHRPYGPYRVLTGPRHHGYASLSLFFNEMAAAATGDVLLLGNDDMVFRTPNWPTAVLAAANLYPDGLFDIGYSTHNATHYPFSTISRKVVDHVGFFWPTHIFWGDIFWRDVMGAFGRTVMLTDVEIEHDWVGFDPNPDQVFTEADKDIERRDPTYWSVTHANAVRETVEKLRTLQEAVSG